MVAENIDGKPEDGDRRAGRDRRKPPLTIDLTAETVAARPEAKPSPTEPPATAASNARPAAGSGPAPEASRPSAGSPPRGDNAKAQPRGPFGPLGPLNIDLERWTGLAAAGAVGAVVALFLLLLLQATGIVPAPGVVAANLAADEARTASSAISSLERRVMAVESMTESLPAARADAAAIAARVAALEESARGLAPRAEIETLRGDLAALRTRIEAMPPAAAATDMTALANRIGRLEASLTAPPAAGAAPPADVETRLTALANRVDALEAAVAEPRPAPPPAEAAPAMVLTALRRAVDAGAPFAAELDAAASLGGGDAAAALRPYAAGVPTGETLRAAFGPVADAILAATAVPASDDSIFGRLVSGARGLVTIRPTGPIAGDDPPAVVSRMEAAVAKGDLATALAEREKLPDAGKAASADWASRAAARVAADRLMLQLADAVGRAGVR